MSNKTKLQIKTALGSVLFEHECEDNSLKKTLEAAVADGADLRGADLRDADLRGADLRDADLRGADLCGADLCGADLRGADLRDADLRGADLRGADLRDADLRGADLRGADLCGADLRGADLRDADLRGATIYWSDNDFNAENKIDRFIYKTQLESVETEMRHNVGTWKHSFNWKNVLKIKSWKLKDSEDKNETPAQEEKDTISNEDKPKITELKTDRHFDNVKERGFATILDSKLMEIFALCAKVHPEWQGFQATVVFDERDSSVVTDFKGLSKKEK